MFYETHVVHYCNTCLVSQSEPIIENFNSEKTLKLRIILKKFRKIMNFFSEHVSAFFRSFSELFGTSDSFSELKFPMINPGHNYTLAHIVPNKLGCT